MTATNVGYGFWSHDIEGPYNNYEMYTRWIQWAAFSGVFRSHDRGMSAGGCADQNPSTCSIVEVWEVPSPYFESNRYALQVRASLIPYIYTAWRQAFDSGLSIVRPMYYDYPLLDGAYWASPDGAFPQYMFGDNIMVSPIVSQSNATIQMTPQSVWIPPGQWYEGTTGYVITGANDGSTVLTKNYDVSETPVFYQAGSIIPQIPVPEGNTIGLAQQQYNTLMFTVYPGGSSGTTQVYEDDGYTMDYLSGQYVWTTASYTQTSSALTFTVSSNGSYSAFPTTRTYILRVANGFPPTSVQANGINVPYARFGGPNTWTYSGVEMSTYVEVTGVSTSTTFTVVVTANLASANGIAGIKGGIWHATLAKANLDIDRSTPGSDSVTGGALDIAASTGEELSYLAGTNLTAFSQVVAGYPAAYVAALSDIGQGSVFTLAQLWASSRNDHVLCGTQACMDGNNWYQFQWIEGYQPLPSEPGAVPLYDYWNVNTNHNWATTSFDLPPGYAPAVFSNGVVLSIQKAGTVPLQLWYNDDLGDHITVASQQGISYAQNNGYTLVTAVLGYVYTSPPAIAGDGSTPIPPARAAYSLALLNSGMN